MYATVGEIDLKDEFALLPHNSVLSDVSKALTPVKNSAALIRAPKGKGIAGIIKAQVLLSALKQGEDPLTFKASEIMSTNLLRLKSETPIEIAIEKITELRPDAVLVIDSDGVFAGYLSAEDFREMKSRFLVSDDVAKNPPETIEDAVKLRDEFRLVPANSTLDKVSLLLRRPSVQFVLAQDKKKGVVGIISVQQILSIFSNKGNPEKERIKSHMKSNLLRLRIDTPIVTAVEAIKEKETERGFGLDREGKIHGFLRPEDYRQLISLMPVEIEHDGTFSSLEPYLKNKVGQEHEGPVVWNYMGSELVVNNQDLAVTQSKSELNIAIPVACDQTGSVKVNVTFDLGDFVNPNRVSVANPIIQADDLIQNQWSKVFIENIWNHVLAWIDSSTPEGTYAGGFAIGESGELITTVANFSKEEADYIER